MGQSSFRMGVAATIVAAIIGHSAVANQKAPRRSPPVRYGGYGLCRRMLRRESHAIAVPPVGCGQRNVPPPRLQAIHKGCYVRFPYVLESLREVLRSCLHLAAVSISNAPLSSCRLSFPCKSSSVDRTTVLRVRIPRNGASRCVKTRRFANRMNHAKMLREKDFCGFGSEIRVVLPS